GRLGVEPRPPPALLRGLRRGSRRPPGARALGAGRRAAGRVSRKEPPMKWITRERVKVDRVACPWLIGKFVDPDAEFLFVPKEQVLEVAGREGAIPFDVEGVELGHH